MTAVVLVAVWLVCSVPFSVAVGRFLAGRTPQTADVPSRALGDGAGRRFSNTTQR